MAERACALTPAGKRTNGTAATAYRVRQRRSVQALLLSAWCSQCLACLRVLEQPRGRSLATRLARVAVVALLHLAVQPRGLLRVLVETMAPLFVRQAENAARLLRPHPGRPTKHAEPAAAAALDAHSA
eukprot:scaffold30160_cov57-Phaeocystis_antarctica.AAC.1